MPKPGKELRARDAKCDLTQELLQSILEMKAGRRGRLHKVTRKAVEQLEKGKGKRSASARALFKGLGI